MNKKILVLGSNGLCGSALQEESVNFPQYDYYFATRKDADLTSQEQVNCLFKTHKPDIIINTSAKVGGIGANLAMAEDFFYDNILINAHVIRAAIENKVEKLFAFSSVCVFPDNLTLLEEDKMHSAEVFDSNFSYGYAKRMIDVHIRAAERQYGVKNYCSIIPGNIFGKHDMFSIEHGHFIPSILHKIYNAKFNNGPSLEIWGDGNSLREVIYVNDIARCILELLDRDIPNKIIISGRREFSIREVVNMICDATNYDENEIVWDTSKPNGQRSRPSSKQVIDSLLPNFQYTDILEGLRKTWNWMKDNYPNVRTEY